MWPGRVPGPFHPDPNTEDKMDIERQIANAPRTAAVGVAVTELGGTCVGCSNCRGLCQALIEVMTFPDAILNRS